MEWMSWTTPTAILFGTIGALLAVMTLLERARPSVPRRGVLPWATTRGDRFFLGLLAAAFGQLAWVGTTDLPPWLGLGPALFAAAAILRWA